jgi:hypothetical protein
VNYDLPWNPQRVEQRIGRCHRYGQQRDVLVLNFLNRQNAADARLFDLLSQKLALFDGVFGSSDEILGALGTGIDFERRVLDIYQSCRSGEEIDQAFSKLRTDLDDRISARYAAARALLFERFDGEVRGRLRMAEQKVKEAVARREAEEEALVAAAFEEEAPPAEPVVPEGPAKGRSKRAKLVQAAAERIRSRQQDAVSFLEVPSRHLPASLGKLAGREGWWFAYKYTLDALVSEERVVHLVLWLDEAGFHALAEADAEAFAALPAQEVAAGPRGATVSIGAAQEEALAALHARLVQGLQERIGAAYDESRDRWDRSVEDALAAPRKAVEDARAAWGRARAALHDKSDLPLRDRRALLERAEREHRRKLDDLRALEAQRYAEKDRAIADLKKRAEVREKRTLVATAYWRCV